MTTVTSTKPLYCPQCNKQIKATNLLTKLSTKWECEEHGELTEVLCKTN